jgi:hypothetical protein
MLNLPRSASARALSPTVLTGCSVQQFRALAGKRRAPSAARVEGPGSGLEPAEVTAPGHPPSEAADREEG